MATLLWDQVGERFYEAGVDRGVLYLPDGNVVVWNGLISVNESAPEVNRTPIYFDAVKYAEVVALGNFTATLKAYTYPDEFLEFEGVLLVNNGLYVTNQPTRRFALSYRTMIGDDIEGLDRGYKIHVLYNLSATPSTKSHQTISEVDPIEFEWTLTSIPGYIPGFRPTSHLIFDTRQMSDLLLQDIEDTLYGTPFTDPRLPDISTITSFVNDWVIIRIIDNFDGTWTAIGPDDLITMLDATTFQIIQANAVYLDADTYMVSNLTY